MSFQILVVEDDERVSESVLRYLSQAGYRASIAPTLASARVELKKSPPAAVVLDLALPDGSGLALLREMRNDGNRVPVIIASGSGAEADQMVGYAAGAIEYLPKPFSLAILAEKIRIWIAETTNGDLCFLHFNPHAGSVANKVSAVHLTPTESMLLQELIRLPDERRSRHDLLAAWRGNSVPKLRSVDHYMCLLRRKLATLNVIDAIRTVRGGYAWCGRSVVVNTTGITAQVDSAVNGGRQVQVAQSQQLTTHQPLDR